MNFELGKKYIVEVSERGIIPREQFLEERYIDKDHDDLDFLTDEEKAVVINEVLDKIMAEIKTNTHKWWYGVNDDCFMKLLDVLEIIDKYREEQK